MSLTIRAIAPRDYARVLEIWRPIYRETTATFASEEKTDVTLPIYVETRRAAGRETFVAETDGHLLGFASYDQFRGGDGYVHAMEHTIILAPEARGRGVGRALMQAVEAHALAGGAHVMVAGVSAENTAGVAFHAALGYVETGRMPQVGRKFGRWLDLVLMQRILTP
ncbi:N-acetyltransferase family protein [Pseudooceanicola sediminis]|uniref:N-acetyltransferase family protein n=1 Tax=Pseudooceanicola sediminis TaxID=2211117 RepID=A0A399IXP8_9RHOB|nr:GNAT family N-acetyltransferase [Pseudooceanicola sediminis]RII37948.1 N-acetyltransferase family protein [Pseudooceanicola sediminis]|tara:strand:+ start:24136 stop:24636 length:501 start_codon:yes stop_codon:yes gene_type:complete